jgi:hypothetical protein
MPPRDELKQKIRSLMDQGQDFDNSFDSALQDYDTSADRSDEVLKMKQQLKRNIRKGQ